MVCLTGVHAELVFAVQSVPGTCWEEQDRVAFCAGPVDFCSSSRSFYLCPVEREICRHALVGFRVELVFAVQFVSGTFM